MVITFKNVSFRYVENFLLDNVNFSITDNDKTGLVGLNGIGKSTILKLIIGEINPTSGEIIKSGNMIINYLSQDPYIKPGISLFDYVFEASTKEHVINDYEIISVLTKLKLNPSDLTTNLSGGQKKRLALAKTMVSYCDYLILDEPTNHLDNDMIMYLEKYLTRFNHGIFMVTHDRYFLERVCNQMIELDFGKIYMYNANYSKFLTLKSQREERQEKEEKKLKSILKKELEWMNRGVEARRTKQKYLIDRFNELSKIKFKNHKDFSFDSITSYLGKKIIEIKDGNKAFNDKVLFKDFSINILRTDRIGIVGDNGAGKTTLFKILMKEEKLDSGELILGETLKIGYFSQHFDQLNEEQTVIDYIKDSSDEIETLDGKTNARGLLEKFLFDSHKQYQMIKTLSGGEKRRLQLVRVLSLNPNVLILDEPTNDLDVYTLEILEDYLDSFIGPVLCVSHDRYFLDKVCDQLLYFSDGHIYPYIGSFSEFLDEVAKPVKKEIEKSNYKNTRIMSSKEKNELFELEDYLPKLEKQIENLQNELSSLTTEYVKMMEIQAEIDKLNSILDEKTIRYFELVEKKESL